MAPRQRLPGVFFLRPFWTKDTGPQFQRDQFSLHWLRGHGKDAEKIWAALKDEPGFFGLLAGGPDVAVRLSAEAVVQRALQQVRFTLQRTEVAFRQATPGARWWKLGPLTPAEVVHVKSLIPQFGLSWEGDQVRFGAAGRFRSFAFFRASEQPSRHSLDEGGWNSSVAELRPAEPPPRQGSKGPLALITRPGRGQGLSGGTALPPQAAWGGPRAPASKPAANNEPVTQRPLASQPGATSRVGPRSKVAPRKQSASGTSAGPLPSVPPSTTGPGQSVEAQLGLLLQQMQALTTQNAAMAAELAELRRENTALRRRLEEASHFVHQPYGPSPMLLDATPVAVEGAISSPPLRPQSPPGSGPCVQDMTTDSPAKTVDPEAKRPRSGGSPPDDA